MGVFSQFVPQGWPWSLSFLIATAVLFLLQRIPYTGIFLMFAMAAFWSVILVNLGFIGIGIEALSGRVSRLWLILPALYFGGYYLLRASEQATLASLRAEIGRFNAGKSVAFDPASQDLVIEKGKGDFHPSAAEIVRRYGLPRAFEGANVHFIADSEACALVRGNEVYRSAGVYALGIQSRGEIGKRTPVHGYCTITAPAAPSRPAVRVRSDDVVGRRGVLPVRTTTLRISDELSARQVEVRAGQATVLKPFPMPVIGCALNSGAPSWDCFAGFMRGRAVPIAPGGQARGWTQAILAGVLGLQPSEDYAAIAAGPDVVRAFGQAADASLIDKEMAVVEQMLAEPGKHHQNSWLFHLPNRPEVIAPLAGRIFAALRTLQSADVRGSETGRNLWRLAAALPQDALAPHRTEMVEWLKPENARPWTADTGEIYARLDGSNPEEREILLHRLETKRGDLDAKLLSSFCRMGAAAPEEVKRRLLALWHKRGEDPRKGNGERSRDDVPLYFTIARMGLKDQAGRVEQRYMGPTFAGIWAEVTPDFADDLCAGSVNDISNRFRRR